MSVRLNIDLGRANEFEPRRHETTRIVRQRNGVWNVVTSDGDVVSRNVSHSQAEDSEREYHRWWALNANEFSPRKSYHRFLRKHKTTRSVGRGVRRGLKRGTGFVYHRL